MPRLEISNPCQIHHVWAPRASKIIHTIPSKYPILDVGHDFREDHSRSYGMNNIIAIDPGANGGVALLRHERPAQAFAMPPTEGDILELLKDLADPPEETIALIEQVSGFAGRPQPGSAMFKFGRNFGFLVGVLQAHGVQIEFVRPARWQKVIGLGTASKCDSKTVWKNKLKASAQRRYPHLKVTLNTADALLILEYGRRFHGVFTNVMEPNQKSERPNVVPVSSTGS
jgi:hypothetical protein